MVFNNIYQTITLPRFIAAHTDFVNDLVFVNDSCFASGSRDNTIKFWSIQTRSLIETRQVHQNDVTFIDILNDNRLVSGDQDGIVKVHTNSLVPDLIENYTNSLTSSAQINFDLFVGGFANGCFKIWNITNNFQEIHNPAECYNKTI